MLRWVDTLTIVSLQGNYLRVAVGEQIDHLITAGNYLHVAVGGYIDQRITAGKLPFSCCGWVH
jgi:hypothetical protein